VQGGGLSARSRKCGGWGALDLVWLGTICRQRTVATDNCVWTGIHNNMSRRQNVVLCDISLGNYGVNIQFSILRCGHLVPLPIVSSVKYLQKS